MENIDCKSLMIGDLVNVHRSECVAEGGQYAQWNEYGIIAGITEYYITINYIGREDDYDFEDVDEKDISPIPLIAEILEKNGFELKPDGWVWAEDKENEFQNYIFIQFRKGCNGVRIAHFNYVNKVQATFHCLQYLHELQHALWLSGIEKEIKL